MSNNIPNFDEAVAEAIAKRDADELELALNQDIQPDGARTAILESLLTETWHHSHEDILRYLQRHPSPTSVKSIGVAITLKSQLDYLSYDDYGAFYKKCFCTLAVNPNPSAIDLIRKYSGSDDEILREQAEYRLAKVERK